MYEPSRAPPKMRIPSRTHILPLLQKVQQGLSTVELIYTPHDRWPLATTVTGQSSSGAGVRTERTQSPLRISVLDSSFNPPTLAHLALANSPRPRYNRDDIPPSDGGSAGISTDYDAKLLLLSVRNADKVIKLGDASLVQRLEMMTLLAKELICQPINVDGDLEANVAVAIIDEPTFVGKSRKLLTFLRNRLADFLLNQQSALAPPPASATSYDPELTFLLGFDTLERLLSPRYYVSDETSTDPMENMMTSLRRFLLPPPLGAGSRVVCARRTSIPTSALTSIPIPFQHDTDNTPIPFVGHGDKLESGPSEPEGGGPSDIGASSLLSLDQADSSTEKAKTLALAREFIDSERITLIDIGKTEQTFSSSAVRELIRVGSKTQHTVERSAHGVDCKDQHAPWQRLVPRRIAEYVIQEGLYQEVRP